MLALLGHVETGAFAAVLPEVFLRVIGPSGAIRAVPLPAPPEEHRIGLIFPDRDPQPPMTTALMAVAADAPTPAAWIGETS